MPRKQGSAGSRRDAEAPTFAPSGDQSGLRRTPRRIVEETMPRLVGALEAWQSALPPDAAAKWPRGAVYVRESTMTSGVGDAPEMQLRNTLGLLASKQVWVPEGGIFFDVASGTSIAGRQDFQRLFEQALAGGYQVIGVFGPDRLFRNQEDAQRIRRAFREQGVELEYLGKFQGDPRDAAHYQLTAMQDMQAETHARIASQYVGRHFEALSRAGRPATSVPEVFAPGDRAKPFLGRPGSILTWTLREPLASIIKEGCRRFLNGATLTELADWSATTNLRGMTPAGHPMHDDWWRKTLTNPKLAGYQHPTVWPGFKPTKAERDKARAESLSQLVPCVLPALWDLDTYERIRATLKARWRGPKERKTYRQYLLSGIAYDDTCGHRMAVAHSERGKDGFWMRCLERTGVRIKGKHVRADIAEQELDDLVGRIRFDDPDLIAAIELELGKRIEGAAAAVETFRPNPEIAALRQAVASLDRVTTDVSAPRSQLQERIEQLVALDEAHREALSRPVVEFREAMARLTDWSGLWAEAEPKQKNKLLRAAEVKVYLGRDEDAFGEPAHLRRVTSDNPVFALALAVGLSALRSRYAETSPLLARYLEIDLGLGASLEGLAERLALTPETAAIGVALPRPGILDMPAEVSETGTWWSTRQLATALGRTHDDILKLVREGKLEVRRHGSIRKQPPLISDAEYQRILREHPGPEYIAAPTVTGRQHVPLADLQRWIAAGELRTILVPNQHGATRYVHREDLAKLAGTNESGASKMRRAA